MSRQDDFRHILLASSGLSPQIVTGALYALKVQNKVDIMEVHIITTPTGERCIKDCNLLGKGGWLERLCRDYGLKAVKYDSDNVYVARKRNGAALDDVLSQEDNMELADFIATRVKELCHNQDTALHLCLAGGRKTMSVLLACSLSLVGRPQDRLYHLLVTPGFESSPNFYYPPKKPAMMTGTDQSTKKPIKMPSNNIELSLAEIPFVRFGSKLDKQDRGLGYRRLVELTQQSLEDKMAGVRASLYVQRNVLNINGMDIRLQPAETMLYAHFARKKASCRDFTCRSCWKCHETWEDSRDIDWTDAEFNQDSALAGYRRNENTVSRKGVDWKPRRSTLNKKILQALDDKDLAENFQITPANDGAGKRGRRYGIRAGKLLLSVVERD